MQDDFDNANSQSFALTNRQEFPDMLGHDNLQEVSQDQKSMASSVMVDVQRPLVKDL